MHDLPSDTLITVDEAIARLDAIAVAPRVETIDLWNADGRTLAAAIAADRDAPAFDKSLVDGYALRSMDAIAPVALRDLGEIAAGSQFDRVLGTGECVAIMTGAPVPPGADAVCPVEATTSTGGQVSINEAIAPGRFVELQGAHWRQGDLLLPANTMMTPAALSVAAAVGAAKISVFARPRVGVLTTGDEIIPLDAAPGSTQLRNSNAILIATLLRRLGCESVVLKHAIDDPAEITQRLQTPDLDAICVTGGMSMGRHDHVPRVMRDLGYSLAITKLRMRPGKPFVVGLANNPLHQGPRPKAQGLIFGLPGNPVSAFVCVVRLASRLLLRMQGRSPEPVWEVAALAADLPANGPREFYQPATATGGKLHPLTWRGSADVLTLARANGLIRRPANAPAVVSGETIQWMRLP